MILTLKEQSGTNPLLRFLIGEKRERAAQLPVYVDLSHKVAGHKDCPVEKAAVFHVLGFGQTRERAEAMAREKVGPDFFCIPDMGCSARFEAESRVAA